ncbi:MAG: PAS domain S-box protein, partial [Rubrobacteraceae bacterium]
MESNRDLTTIFESITDAFFSLDREWRFTYLNSEAERVLSRSRKELLGKNMWDEFPEAVGSRFDQEYHKAMEGQVSVEFEDYHPSLEAWVEVKAYPSEAGLLVYFQDVNKLKRTEEDLRESETKYRTLVEQIPAIVYTETLDGGDRRDHRLLYVSPQVETILGYSPDEWMKNPDLWEELLHPEDRDGVLAEDARTERTGEPFKAEYRIRASDGR